MDKDYLNLKNVLFQLYADRWRTIIFIIACLILSTIYHLSVSPIYTATTTLFNTSHKDERIGNIWFDLNMKNDVDEVLTYWEIIRINQDMKEILANEFIGKTADISFEKALEEINYPKNFSIVKVNNASYVLNYKNKSPETAILILENILKHEPKINKKIEFSGKKHIFKIVDDVYLNEKATRPKKMLNYIFSFFVGLWLGILSSIIKVINYK